jgi:hypothetical protein
MSPNLEPIDPLADPGWDDLVATHPASSFVHTAAWARVLSSSYGYSPVYFAAVKDSRLQGLIPFMEIRSWVTGCRGVSLPFLDECELILPEGTEFREAFRVMREYAKSRRWRTFELRTRIPGMEGVPASATYYFHSIALSEREETIFSGFRSNVQRNIRKVQKEGVTVDREESRGGVREFYRLNCLTRKEHGLPVQPYRFFENLRKHVLSEGKGTLLLASYRGECVAGAIFLQHGDKVVYKYGASDRRYQHLRANNLVMWEAIRSYGARGYREFSFGRTDLNHDGLRRFKLSWGCSEKVLKYARFDMKSGAWQEGKAPSDIPGKSVLAMLPVPVLRVLGAIAYSHIG